MEGVEFRSMVPWPVAPGVLAERARLLDACERVDAVLNPTTAINRDFDTFALMPAHNDMAR